MQSWSSAAADRTSRFFGMVDDHENVHSQLPPTLPHLVKAQTPANVNNNYDARCFVEKGDLPVKYVERAYPHRAGT